MADTLKDLTGMLAIPGLPSWVGIVMLVAIAISALSLLAMPYSVFGVKSRLEAIEAEIADLRMEIRALIRQPATPPAARAATEEDWVAPPGRVAARTPAEEPRLTPPVPPPPTRPARGRAEPKLDWPRADKTPG